MNYAQLIGKRLAGIDFGRKRIGISYCDELHITVTPAITLYYDRYDFWQKLCDFLEMKKIFALVVGKPYNLEGKETEVIKDINSFIEELKNKTGLDVIEFDESFSTKKAVDTMINNGKRKKYRSKKENKDMYASAIILKEFLDELHY